MRASAVLAVLLLAAAPLPSLAVDPPTGHLITCASPRVSRLYDEALREYHLGAAEGAVRRFEEVVRRDGECAMAQWGLSRALRKGGRAPEALAAQAKAEALAPNGDDRERRLIQAWGKVLKAPAEPDAERNKALAAVRTDLDRALTLYPDDPEVWILRGDAAESPLRAGPFYLAALRVQPSHPLASSWKPAIPPLPEVAPAPTNPVGPCKEAPTFFEGLGKLSHPMTTKNASAQAFYEQGLRCFHSYVNPARAKNGAAVCFQHAANLDPEAPMPYWGLSFCPTDAMKNVDAASRALELALKHGTDREKRFCATRVLELGGAGKREQFLDALDAAILAYPDDVELWTWRGKVYGAYGQGSGPLAGMPYQLAAYRIDPEHPSASHELVHAYEAQDRPALGWPYTEAYRRSAPNMPHANHMQAHLAMRIGRWEDAISATRASRRKSLEGYPELDPGHHVDILIRALAHEGRFQEAESEPRAYRDGLPWARLLQLKADPAALAEWAERRAAAKSPEGIYVSAIVKLDEGDTAGAEPFIAQVEEQFKKSRANIYRFHEVKGRYLVQTGKVEEGLKLLREAAAKAVKDSGLHAWGGGSYMLEVWGESALRAHLWKEAEEAYHEALAHEHGSILGALGMQVAWEHQGNADLAAHYAARSRAIWKGADPGSLDRQLSRLRKLAAASVASGPVGEKGVTN